MTIAEMAASADFVFVGDTVQTNSAWNAGHTMIFTTVRQRVVGNLAFKGTSAGSDVVWQQPGGRVANIVTTVYDSPIFLTGDRALLFLVAPAHMFVVPTIAGDLGKIEVVRDGQQGEAVILWRDGSAYFPAPVSPRSERVAVPLTQLGSILKEAKP